MNYDIVQLSGIDLSKLELVKESTTWINGQDHSRWVFRDDYCATDRSRHSRYLKIWNPQHVRRNNVLRAMEAGFYDETIVSALTALIFHEGICRGYITEASRVTYKIDRSFYETLKKKTIACDFFAIQFSRSHVGIHNDRYSLIDLEAVHPIKDLPKMQSLHAFFDDNDYGRFVTSRFLALYPGKRADLGDYYFLSKKTRTTVRNKILSALYPIRMLRIWQRQFQQWMNIKLRATHTHLIEL